jgi:hypothetical protein
MIQKIQCDKPELSHKNACHMMEGTVCHLINHCGDIRKRFESCTFDYDLSPITPTLIKFVSERRLFLVPLILAVPVLLVIAVIPDVL